MGRFYSLNQQRGNLLTCVFAGKHRKIANPLVRVDCLWNVAFATVEMPQLVLKALHWATLHRAVCLDHTLRQRDRLDYASRRPSG
jgi:hypothetical protein